MEQRISALALCQIIIKLIRNVYITDGWDETQARAIYCERFARPRSSHSEVMEVITRPVPSAGKDLNRQALMCASKHPALKMRRLPIWQKTLCEYSCHVLQDHIAWAKQGFQCTIGFGCVLKAFIFSWCPCIASRQDGKTSLQVVDGRGCGQRHCHRRAELGENENGERWSSARQMGIRFRLELCSRGAVLPFCLFFDEGVGNDKKL